MTLTASVGNPGSKISKKDRRTVLWIVAAVFAVVLLFTVFGPSSDEDNPEPTTYNDSSQGIAAAYLLLPELGYQARRWDAPATDLRNVDASRTTVVFTNPKLPVKDLNLLRDSVAEFLMRGGHVLATGRSGALLLPGGSTADPTLTHGLCFTQPEGSGALARAGQVAIADYARWAATGPQYHIEQRCGTDAVVVRLRVGEGEAIWWSSAMPLSNQGLSADPSLKLTLASLGTPGHTVLFDEYMHTWRDSIRSTVAGLPWWSLALQLVAAALLLVYSFSRRSGPLRLPVTLPRTSPIEFAESMGHLYAKAGATSAATDAARGRVLDFLREHCGIPREQLRAQPPSVAETLSSRFGGEWTGLEQHLRQAGELGSAPLAAKSALKLVQSLDADFRRLRETMRMHRPVGIIMRSKESR